jgi:hypothetical protein
MIETTRAQLPKYVVRAMVVVGTIPMPPKVIGRKVCLQSKSPFRLSKDVGPKGAQTLEGGESTLWWYILGKKKYILKVHFVLFWGRFSSISFNFLQNTKTGFLTRSLQHNSYYLSNDKSFQQTFMYSHIYAYLNEKIHPNVF